MYNQPYLNQSSLDLLGFYTFTYVQRIFDFLARFAVALIIVIIGFTVAKAFEYLVQWIVRGLRINDLLKNLGLEKVLEKTNVSLQTERFLGALTFWVVWVLFWMPSFDILGWSKVNEFLTSIVNYLPTAIVSSVIVVVSYFLADFLRKVAYVWFKGLELKGAKTAAEFVFYAILIFGIASALYQLNVAREIISLIVAGIILGFSLAFGLAVGLGGQELAKEMLNKLKEKFEDLV